jgi:hypothetical protein
MLSGKIGEKIIYSNEDKKNALINKINTLKIQQMRILSYKKSKKQDCHSVGNHKIR